MLKFIPTIVAAFLLSPARAQLRIEADEWDIPADGVGPLPSRNATVGETITFEWFDNHNVFIHPSGDCSEDGAVEVGSSSGAEYVFTADDVGDVFFVCDVGSHCENGMQLTVTVADDSAGGDPTPAPATNGYTPAPAPAPSTGGTAGPAAAPTDSGTGATITIDAQTWSIPSNGGPVQETSTANVGDTITFEWDGTHNVFIHPNGGCDVTNAIEVAISPGGSYVFAEDDAGKTITFACDIGEHCEDGMFLQVQVAGDAPAPSPSEPASSTRTSSCGLAAFALAALIPSLGLF